MKNKKYKPQSTRPPGMAEVQIMQGAIICPRAQRIRIENLCALGDLGG
jgi:hypothetical protein